MTLSRRTALKLGISAGALPLFSPPVLGAELSTSPPDPANVYKAHMLPLGAVKLTGGPLRNAQELDVKYLLELEPDRMLAYYRDRAKLARKAEPYGGWDGPNRNLTGHIAGHYLSAVAYMYAATGDVRMKERADYIVKELKECQDANGDGFAGALANVREAFAKMSQGQIRSGSFDLNGEWSPWYTLHKTYAGLRDAYRLVGNKTALEVSKKFAAWAEGVLAPLNDEQLQHMMICEFGGMNETLADLYADTGDKRWLDLSYKFEHRVFMDPLKRHQDKLGGTHGNTAVPKVMGSLARYTYTEAPEDLMASSFFWDRVVQHHSFSSGGHGKDEYFGPPDQLSPRVDGRTAESCNVYNMIKMTRTLFALRPDAHYADFHERALYNHVLASIDPQDGRTCYMVPVGRGVTREYQNMFGGFTCCVGSGMESHALHAHGIYFQSGDRMWVNLYAPTVAQWKEAGVQVTQETEFPIGETAKFTFQVSKPKEFAFMVRKPYWAGAGFGVKVNGEAVTTPPSKPGMEIQGRSQYPAYVESSYVEVKRTWRTGDVVEVTLPKTLRLEPLPDNPRRVSVMWGPLVLAGDLGAEPARPQQGQQGQPRPRPTPPVVPIFVAANQPVTDWVQPVAGQPGHFRTVGVGREPNAGGATRDVELSPFYALHRRVYSTYWDLFTPPEWDAKKAEYVAEAERVRKLEAATTAWLVPGDRVFEDQFNYQGAQDAQNQQMLGRVGRRAGTWFSYDVPIAKDQPMSVLVTVYSDDRRGMPAQFDVLIDGQVVGEAKLERAEPPQFYDLTYAIPEALTKGKEKVTVKFQAKPNSQVAVLFGVRLVRANELK